MSDQLYFLPDDRALEIWVGLVGIASYGAPDGWAGNGNLRTFILASIWKGASSPSADSELRAFLQKLDEAFRKGPSLLDAKAFSEVIAMWSSIASSSLFDTRHAEWADKPYYRCQIASGTCQLFIAYVNAPDDEKMAEWIERVFECLSRMVDLAPIDSKAPGYFFENEEAAAAQNYNLAVAFKLGTGWLSGWTPDMVSTLSNVSESEARRIAVAIAQRADDTAVYRKG